MNPLQAAALQGALCTFFAGLAWDRAHRCGLSTRWAVPSAIALVLAIAMSAWRAEGGAASLASVCVVACAVTGAVTDLEAGYIFDRVLVAAAAIAGVSEVWSGRLGDGAAGALLAASVFGCVYVMGRGRTLGLGDVKFAATLGLGLGAAGSLVALWCSWVCGGVVAAALLLTRRAERRSEIRFGPFIALGALVALARFA